MGRVAIIIRGGAGAISRAQMTPERGREYVAALSTVVKNGQEMLAAGASAPDAVTGAVRLLEKCLLFSIGMGAIFTHDQTHEPDACVTDSYSLQAGAVAGVKHLHNPVLAACLVLEESPRMLLIGKGAENFVFSRGVECVENDLFFTPERLLRLQETKVGGEIILDHHAAPLDERQKMSIVGVVALDLVGNLATTVSTDDMANKLSGRVDDSPLPGVGYYANNTSVAVSCAGTGEAFMHTLAAYDIAALMEYGQLSLYTACEQVVIEKLPTPSGGGGLTAIDREDNVVLPFNSEGVYRAWCYAGDTLTIGIYHE